jgi:hypothetical protein
VAVVAEHLTVPDFTDPKAFQTLVRWFLDHMSPYVLASLTRSGKVGIVEACLAIGPAPVLRALLETDTRQTSGPGQDDEDVDEETLALGPTAGAATPDEFEAEDSEPDPDVPVLEQEEVRQLTSNLSEEAAATLTLALTAHISEGNPAPRLASELLQVRGDLSVKGALAVAAIINDPNLSGLESWVGFAGFCSDGEAKANAALALLERIGIADEETLELPLRYARQLTTETNRALVSHNFAVLLDATSWTAGSEEARAKFGNTLVKWMAETKLPDVSDVVISEARAALPFVPAGRLDLSYLTSNAEVMTEDHASDLDRLLRDTGTERTDEPLPALSVLVARLRLRLAHPDLLEPIPAAVVGGTYNKHSASAEPGVPSARIQVINAWFASSRTDKEVLVLLRAAGHSFATQTAKWMPTVTPIQATNVWIFATRRHTPQAVATVTRAVQLDTNKVAARMREMASSDDLATRQKALSYARMFPKYRADSERAVQEVAAQLERRGGDERRQAYRLLAEYQPRRLMPTIQEFILGAPKSFARSKAEKALRKRVKKRT